MGLGVKCSKEVATAIRGAIILAKLSIVPVRRGYWGNKIGKPHTVPCKVTGRCGSVLVRLIPAPRGTGIVSAPVPKKLLMMAGIDDCYTSARGCTATLGNFGKCSQFNFLRACLFFLLALPNFTCRGVVDVIRRERNECCNARQKDLWCSLLCSLSDALHSIHPPHKQWNYTEHSSVLITFICLQLRPLLMPSPRLTATWPQISGRRPSSPSLLTRYKIKLEVLMCSEV